MSGNMQSPIVNVDDTQIESHRTDESSPSERKDAYDKLMNHLNNQTTSDHFTIQQIHQLADSGMIFFIGNMIEEARPHFDLMYENASERHVQAATDVKNSLNTVTNITHNLIVTALADKTNIDEITPEDIYKPAIEGNEAQQFIVSHDVSGLPNEISTNLFSTKSFFRALNRVAYNLATDDADTEKLAEFARIGDEEGVEAAFKYLQNTIPSRFNTPYNLDSTINQLAVTYHNSSNFIAREQVNLELTVPIEGSIDLNSIIMAINPGSNILSNTNTISNTNNNYLWGGTNNGGWNSR